MTTTHWKGWQQHGCYGNGKWMVDGWVGGWETRFMQHSLIVPRCYASKHPIIFHSHTTWALITCSLSHFPLLLMSEFVVYEDTPFAEYLSCTSIHIFSIVLNHIQLISFYRISYRKPRIHRETPDITAWQQPIRPRCFVNLDTTITPDASVDKHVISLLASITLPCMYFFYCIVYTINVLTRVYV